MTWNELKEIVEKALKEAGKDGEIEIDYFSFSANDLSITPEAYVDKGILSIY